MGLPIFPNRWHCEDWLQKISKKIFILLDLFSRYRILPSDQPVAEATGNGPKNPGKKIFSNRLSLIFRSFGHGLSISNKRANKIKIMLPVTEDGAPDYGYMEQYVKNIMLRKYRQYLAFLDSKIDTPHG